MTTPLGPTKAQIDRARPFVAKAIREGNIANLQQLFAAGFPPTHFCEHPSTSPLMLAATISTPETMQFILATGAVNINETDTSGRTALHFACRKGMIDNINFLLSQPGIDIEARTCGGMTPLMYVAQSGDIHAVAACLNRGLNPFQRNSIGQRPIDLAAAFQNVQETDLRTLFEKAEEQWSSQLSKEDIEARCTPV